MKKVYIARPYAQALFEMGIADDTLDYWRDFLAILDEVCKHKDIIALYNDPNVGDEDLISLLIHVSQDEISSHGENFIKILVHNHRFKSIHTIAKVYNEMLHEHESVGYVEIISSIELTNDTKDKLKDKLLKKLAVNEIIFDCKIDEAMIGGLIVKIDNKVLDGSIRGKLSQLQEHLLN